MIGFSYLMIIQAFRWKEDNRSFLYDLLV